MGDSNINDTANAVLTEQEIDEAIKGMSNEELYCVFAVNLLAERGYTNVNNPEGEKLIAELVPRIEAFVTQELFFALPDKQLKELEGLMNLEVASPEEIQRLYKEAGIDMDEVVSKALDDFRDMYLGNEKQSEGGEE
jgi:hypothetical protein